MFLEQQIMSRQSCFSLSRHLLIRSKVIGLDLPKPRTSIKEEKNSYDIMQSLYNKIKIHRAISKTMTFRVGCFLGSGAIWDTDEQGQKMLEGRVNSPTALCWEEIWYQPHHKAKLLRMSHGGKKVEGRSRGIGSN